MAPDSGGDGSGRAECVGVIRASFLFRLVRYRAFIVVGKEALAPHPTLQRPTRQRPNADTLPPPCLF
jgi:hypothetical protein